MRETVLGETFLSTMSEGFIKILTDKVGKRVM